MTQQKIFRRIGVAAVLTCIIFALSGCAAKYDGPNPPVDDSKGQGGGRPDPNSFRRFDGYFHSQVFRDSMALEVKRTNSRRMNANATQNED